ncbi:RNA 3'-terminal phosphate cyclase [Achromobacter deleyi]|uniref:RNA 3'-terminal phosphate cyclase n=1 Tax=Achromobacter deleyi TaxID=1353891 RepID=UPI001491F4BD|nr:RNA 3'-terminal phosphate cyclase [Achromobacter deleyi]QVQ26505.1 RNA 3'-terminal phosphate cyclase [Achromobacter deleyi]UIP22077.1 RNA 3'-terminal phosphate cyclase [Achromobacter deleyi]
MIELDGSEGEGGGQILRTSLALSMITGRPLRIHRIRAKRSKPGLMRQHLACVRAAVDISGARCDGAELGSQELSFTPGAIRAGDYRFAIASAGSCMLVLQTVLPALLAADGPSRVELQGGTHNPLAPSFDFVARAYAPLARRLGAGIALELTRRGFYPAGGGAVTATITPPDGGLKPLNLAQRGDAVAHSAECVVASVPRSVARRELETLGAALDWPAGQLRIVDGRQNEGPGNALAAVLEYSGVTEVFTAFGAKGVAAEAVAHSLAREVRDYLASDAALGPHLADQWLLLAALAVRDSGEPTHFTCSELTGHTLTNASVIERFLPVAIRHAPCSRGHRVDVAPA